MLFFVIDESSNDSTFPQSISKCLLILLLNNPRPNPNTTISTVITNFLTHKNNILETALCFVFKSALFDYVL